MKTGETKEIDGKVYVAMVGDGTMGNDCWKCDLDACNHCGMQCGESQCRTYLKIQPNERGEPHGE